MKLNKSLCLLILLFIFLFIIVLFLNNNYSNEITKLDKSIIHYLNMNINENFIIKIMLVITFFGSFEILSLIVIILFIINKYRNFSINIALISIGTLLINRILKIIYNRPRPDFTLIEETGNSLPSGHAMCSIVFYGFIIFFINLNIRNRCLKVLLTILFVILIILIGFSRIYLNVHFPSDVISAYVFGLISLLIGLNIIKYEKVKL